MTEKRLHNAMIGNVNRRASADHKTTVTPDRLSLTAKRTQKGTTMHKIISSIIAFVITILTISCTHTDETGQFRAVDSNCWKYGDSLLFRFNAPDSVWQGDIAIVVRHAASYPYSNLLIELGGQIDGDIAVDTFNIMLADDFGNWLGRGSGLSFQRVDTIVRNVSLSAPSDLYVRHIMRADCITDIEQIGLIFSPYHSK